MWFRAVGCILTLTLSLLMALLAAHAQPLGKIPRIGVIMQGTPPGEAGDELDVFRQGLRDLGYVEGQTITLEVCWGEGLGNEALTALGRVGVRCWPMGRV